MKSKTNMERSTNELEDLKKRKKLFLENYSDEPNEHAESIKENLVRDIGAYYFERI